MGFEPIKRIIPHVVVNHGMTNQIQSRQVLETVISVLRSMWGEERAALVLPVSFKEGTLKVESTSAAAKQQLLVEQVRIMNELNRKLGQRCVKQLDIRSKGF